MSYSPLLPLSFVGESKWSFTGWDEGGEALVDRLEGIELEGDTNAYNHESPHAGIREGTKSGRLDRLKLKPGIRPIRPHGL